MLICRFMCAYYTSIYSADVCIYMYVCCRLPSAYRPFPLHVIGCHGFEILVPDACIGCQRFRLSASHAFIRTCGPNRVAFAAEGIVFTQKNRSGRLQTNASDA